MQRELQRRPQSSSLSTAEIGRAVVQHDDEDAGSAESTVQRAHQDDCFRSVEGDSESQGNIQGAMEQQDEKPMSRRQGIADILHHWAWITIFSIFGTLTRLGIQALNTYPGQIAPSLVWAQFIGCAVMGFLTEDNKLFPKADRYDALFLGLTVGYCGSTTTFSSWILQVFEDVSNTRGYARNRGYNVISVLSQVMVTLAASLFAFRLGSHIAILADKATTLRPVPRMTGNINIILLLLLAICFQAATIITTALRRDWRGIVAIAMVFSPAGALTRWYLSRWLNSHIPSFPLGTFVANMIGSLLESIFYILQYHTGTGNSCSILQGLQDGYCGALTTVSTFILELATLRRRHAYIYASTSIVTGIIIYVLVDGIDYWTHGSATGYQNICTFDKP